MSQPKYTDDDLKRAAGIMEDQFNDKFDVVLEVVTDIQTKIGKIDKIEQDVEKIKTDMKIVKAAVTDTNHELHKLDKRVAHLEAV